MTMNIYKPDENGNATGIEWTKIPGVVAGASWNPIAGCFNQCKWLMPDGVITCYAETIANRFDKHYPNGFQHRYWYPDRLAAPGKKKEPHGIFAGSMADMFGNWVDGEHIEAVLNVCRNTPQHTYFTLTKNPKRLTLFNLPDNVWAGCSLPGGPLRPDRDPHYDMWVNLTYMSDVAATVRWVSLEPLWFDVAETFRLWIEHGLPLPFDWMVIGAGSKGKKLYQPEEKWVDRLVNFGARHSIPIFMKDNLEWWKRQEQFPDVSVGGYGKQRNEEKTRI